MSSSDKYFKDFFAEKDGIQEFNYSDMKGNHVYEFNYTPDDILKIILSMDESTKRKIRDQFVKIDFANGDINDYIDFLMTVYVKIQMGEKP